MSENMKISDYAKSIGKKSSEIINFLNKQGYKLNPRAYSKRLTSGDIELLNSNFKPEEASGKVKKSKEGRKIVKIIKKHKVKEAEEKNKLLEKLEEKPEVKEEEKIKVEKKEEKIVEKSKKKKIEKKKEVKLEEVEIEKEEKPKREEKKKEEKKQEEKKFKQKDKFKKKFKERPHKKEKKKGIKFEEVKTIDSAKEKAVTSEDYSESKKKKKKKKKKHIDKEKILQSVEKTIKSIKSDKIGTKKKYKDKSKAKKEDTEETKKLLISDHIIVSDLAEKMEIDPIELIETAISLGIMVTINQRIDFDNASILAMEFGFDVEKIVEVEEEEKEIEEEKIEENYELFPRPPVITIMGHVDHGKTTLIDYLRKSRIVDSEHGKITQDIGAYTVNTDHGKLTVIDTPGHEAFTAMRARGASITDMAIIVIAANDGVMPQTKEAISHAQLANVPFIIAINKIDLPEADPFKVKQQLMQENIVVEEYGGSIPCVNISAKTGEGVDELMETVLLQSEIMELKAPHEGTVKATVIEVKQDKGLGPVINCIIQKGILHKGDIFVVGKTYGKVRKLLDEFKQDKKEAYPSEPIMIVGTNELPSVGDVLNTVENEKKAKEIARKRYFAYKEQQIKKREITSMDLFERQLKQMQKKEVNVIIKGKVFGSIEALADSLQMLSNDDFKINIVYKEVGIVTENDVNIAIASGAHIIAFNTNVDNNAKTYAKREGIIIKQFNVIYDVIDEINAVIKSLQEPEFERITVGSAVVRQVFNIKKIGVIAGLYVTDGYIERNAEITVLREGEDLGTYKIKSLKRFQNDVKRVETGYECAVILEGMDNIQIDDVFKVIITKQKVE